MKKILHNISVSAKVLAITAVTLLLLPVACTNDPDTGYAGGADGEMRILLPLSVPQSDARTRAQSIDDNTIQTLWIGMFETTRTDGDIDGDARLVKYWAMSNIPMDGKTSQLELALPKKDNVFGPNNTGKPGCLYHIVGIANYLGVNARRGETEDSLIELLRQTETWEEFCSTAIDTESAAAQTYPIMQGALITNNSAAAQMIYPENFGFHKPRTFEDTDATKTCRLFSSNYLLNTLDFGVSSPKLYLRRLIASVSVNLSFDFAGESSYDKITVENIRYAVVNTPKNVYLQERIVPEDPENLRNVPADVLTSESYKQYSANWCDWEAESFRNLDGEAESVSLPGSYTHVKGVSESSLQFDFQYNRYENKHAGKAGDNNPLKEFADREHINANRIYTALCPDGVTPYNNFAPYFVITADMTLENNGQTSQHVAARYVIHEGLANTYEAVRRDIRDADYNDAVRLRDFSCVRNSSYNYQVDIKGIKNIMVRVNADQFDFGEYERNGVSGDVSEILGTKNLDSEQNTEWSIELTDSERAAIADNWLFVTPYRAKLDDGQWVYERVEFGYSSLTIPSIAEVQGGGTFYDATQNDALNNLEDNQFYNWVQFYDQSGSPLGGIAEFAASAANPADNTTRRQYTIKVQPNTYQKALDSESPSLTGDDLHSTLNFEEDTRALYFCIAEPVVGTDGISTYQKMYYLTQKSKDERPQLDTPTFIDWTTPAYINEAVRISWSTVLNADYYTYTYGNEPQTSTGETEYKFYPATSLEYGDILDFTLQAYPEHTAEYKASEEAVLPVQVFRRQVDWDFSDAWYGNNLPNTGDNNLADWTDIMKTMQIKGGQFRANSGTSLQLGGTGSTDNAIRIMIPASGLLTVSFSNTGSSSTALRYLSVFVDGTEYISEAGSNNTARVTESFNIVVDAPTYLYIYSTASNAGGLRFYDVKYEVGKYKPTTWDSTSTAWSSFVSDLTGGRADTDAYDKTVNGLRLFNAAGTTLKIPNSNKDAIQLAGGGVNKQFFSFKAISSGTLTIEVSGNSSDPKGDGRGVYILVGEDGNPEFNECDTGSTKISITHDIMVPNSDEGTEVFIYSTNGNIYYSISYDGGIKQ